MPNLAAEARERLERDIVKALMLLLEASVNELQAQGYSSTGKTIKSLGIRVETSGAFSLDGVLFGSKVLDYLDTGTKPHFPPVDAIKQWLIQKGVSESEAEAAKWPISITISREGTPTSGSYAFSNNGRRTEWSTFALKASRPNLIEAIRGSDWVRQLFRQTIRQHNKVA